MASARKTPLHKLVLKGYLFLYHSAALSLWAIVVFHAFQEVVQHGRPLTLKDAAKLFTEVFAATAAQLEMVVLVTMLDAVHALLGWIPGPSAGIIVPLLQRGLMLVVLNGMRVLANGLTGGIMVFAWALLEIPRYSYYLFAAFNEEADAVPKTLFFLRYTAFVLVYPMASVCEGLIMWGAFPILTGENNVRKVAPYGYTVSAENASRALKVFMALYVMCTPMVFVFLADARKKAYQDRVRASTPPAPENGIVFPKDETGKRGTMEFTRQAVVAAMEAAGAPKDAVDKAKSEPEWHLHFPRHYENMVRAAVASKEAALGSAEAGLQWLYGKFEFIKEGHTKSLVAAQAAAGAATTLHTGVVKGTKTEGKVPLYHVPYDGPWHPSDRKNRYYPDKLIGAMALKTQLKRWVKRGHMEQDAADAIWWTAEYFEEGDKDLSKCYFVVMGAFSFLQDVGPLTWLLRYGANVVAIDEPGCYATPQKPTIWRRLVAAARTSRGQVIFPMDTPQADCPDDITLCAAAGSDIMAEPFDTANWLVKWAGTIPKDAKVIIGNYAAVTQGPRQVKMAMAADVLIAALRKARPSTAVAFMCSPYDVHVVPAAAAAAAKKAYGFGLTHFGLDLIFRFISLGRYASRNVFAPATFAPAEKEKGAVDAEVHLINGLCPDDSPNAALARRIQLWRATIEYEAGATVSAVVYPTTATLALLEENKAAPYFLGGFAHIGQEVFKMETSTALTTAVLIHDLLNPETPKDPKNRAQSGVRFGLEVASSQAMHGGLWRAPFTAATSAFELAIVWYCVNEVAAVSAMAGFILGSLYFIVWYTSPKDQDPYTSAPKIKKAGLDPSLGLGDGLGSGEL